MQINSQNAAFDYNELLKNARNLGTRANLVQNFSSNLTTNSVNFTQNSSANLSQIQHFLWRLARRVWL